MSPRRRALPALAGLMVAGLMLAGFASPAGAAPPFPSATQATALVSGVPLVEARCPSGPTLSGGTSTKGNVKVGISAGARCTNTSAATDGEYSITGVTPALPVLRFSAQCVTAGVTNGGVDVPVGASVNGVPVVGAPLLVQTPNTPVTYAPGVTAIVNEVIVGPNSVQRNAIRILTGPDAGTIIGRVICGAADVYPLAVDTAAATGAAPALAASTSSSGGSSNTRLLLLAGGALVLLVLAQVTVGRSMWRRRRGLTG